MFYPVVQVREAARLAGGGIRALFLPYHDGRAPPFVAGGDDAVFRKKQQGARTFDAAVHVLDAVHKVSALDNQQGNQFRGIRVARTQFRKMPPFVQEFLLQFRQVLHLGHRDDGKPPQMGVHHDGLGIRVAYHADARIALELRQVCLKL